MKSCSKCKNIRDLSEFSKDRSSKDGLRSQCKSCQKLYRQSVSDKSKEYRKRYWKENGDKFNADKRNKYDSQTKKEYYEKNKIAILEKRKVFYEINKESKLSYQKNYQENNREKRNRYLSERRKNDEIFRLTTNIRNLVINSFLNNGYEKKSKTEQILGCTFEEFKIYLESKFENWMNWSNRGLYNGTENYGWDIDHINPISSADKLEDIIKLNHYTNLQPLCSKINRDIKKNKICQVIIH